MKGAVRLIALAENLLTRSRKISSSRLSPNDAASMAIAFSIEEDRLRSADDLLD